jgi:hypothetical protein
MIQLKYQQVSTGSPPAGLVLKLALVQFPIQSFLRQQFIVFAPLHAPAAVEHEDMIGMADGAEPVRNHNSGSAL